MLKDNYPYYLANEPISANADLEVTNKYTGEVATRVAVADGRVIDDAIGRAVAAAPACRKMPSYARAAVLNHVVKRMTERYEELARALAIEAGKPIKDARGEVTRGIDTFRIAAEEATRIYGQYLPLDISPRAEGYEGLCKRVPIGVCSFISPFNFPINLAAHKVAPAIAVGCPFVLKPASRTPIGALIIGEILAETALPKGAFSILPCGRDGADLFTTDERIKLLSFTGSPDVGWALKAKAGKKKVVLELGGNAACIVDRDADLEYAVQRLIIGAFYQSGQSCIGVQRIFIHESIYDSLNRKLADAASKLISGDPLNEDTFIGPMITEGDAKRIEKWCADAVKAGARIVCGGHRKGAIHDATLLEHVPDDADLSCNEAFGPVAIMEPFISFKSACDRVNASAFGLQAGVFTNNIHHAYYAFNELEVGGVVINDVPSFRVDNMPYGGVKDSGLGREGIRYAIEDMTELRLMVMNRLGSRAT
ncbi:MAG: aldehyde dehydrogenase family protein [Phycisphaerales bacterium]|nr:aldehyde dehydrogenase family protein [Phycisphaerales bacterium]